MRCNYTMEDIIKITEKTVSEESRIEFEKHIKSCGVCKNAYAALVLTEKFSAGEAKADDHFHKDIVKHLDTKRYSKNNVVLYKFRKVIKPALSIAACLVILFTSFTYRQQISEFVTDTYNAVAKRTDDTNETNDDGILGKDKIGKSESVFTAVIKPCTGKKGPGGQYEDVIDLPYGRVIGIVGRHKEDIMWCLARVTPGLGENEAEEFWVNIENLDAGGYFNASFESCSVSEASMFNRIIENETPQYDVKLRTLPDKDSAPVTDVKNGDLVAVLRQDSEWSLVRKLTEAEHASTSYTGWINNVNYTLCKKGMTANQGFVLKNTKILQSPDENSKPQAYSSLKSLIAPVVIESVQGEWAKVSAGFAEPSTDNTNGIPSKGKLQGGWVKTSDLITSFDGIDTYALANPEIDKTEFADKIRNEILNWKQVTLNAYDVESKIMLTESQKKDLAQSLKSIDDIEFFDGGILNAREALYPFYSLEFDINSDPELGYSFVVAGEDRLVVNIPSDRFDYYGFLNRERAPVRFIKVNKEFVECIRSLLPPPDNSDKDNMNYLLSAQEVLITYGEGNDSQVFTGTGPQVYKCVRTIMKYMGAEWKGGRIPGDSKEISTFEFAFADSSSIKVVIYDKYIKYGTKYYAVKDNTENILPSLFAGYF